MEPRQTGPLYSSLADDPDSAARLDRFVLELAERVDHLQDADASGELDVLVRGAEELVLEAMDAGHAVLAQAARQVADVARLDKAEDAHAALVELTDVAQRVRRGHRGAI